MTQWETGEEGPGKGPSQTQAHTQRPTPHQPLLISPQRTLRTWPSMVTESCARHSPCLILQQGGAWGRHWTY